MAANASIAGLAVYWEGCREIRERIRDKRMLFLDEVGGKKLDVNIRGAESHVDVLVPLLQKLVDPATLAIGMCAIPQLETEQLNSI